jgi:hypothetical protein
MYRLFQLAFAFIVMSAFAGVGKCQSPGQLRPQLPPSPPPTFTPPRPVAPSPGPAVHPYVAPSPGGFQNGAQAGFITRQGQHASVQAGPGYVGGQISTPTNIGGK